MDITVFRKDVKQFKPITVSVTFNERKDVERAIKDIADNCFFRPVRDAMQRELDSQDNKVATCSTSAGTFK